MISEYIIYEQRFRLVNETHHILHVHSTNKLCFFILMSALNLT